MALSELGVPDFLRDRTAGKTRKEIERHQSELIPEAIAAAARSPFWARRFGAAGVKPEAVRRPDDLYRLPTLDKPRYMAALEADEAGYGGLLCGDLEETKRSGAIVYRSTGTTGRQARFINTHAGFQVFGDQGARLMVEAGARPGDFVMITFPLSFWAAGWGFYYGSRTLPATLIPAGAPADGLLRLQLIREYRPAVVVLTPSYALTLGRQAEAEGFDLPSFGVRGLLLGGETFPQTRRQKIEELWGVRGGTRNFYGISEGGPLFAMECSAQDGLHLFEEDQVHQFWAPEGNQPVEAGELGEHVFTALKQRVMATWVNFRSRDAAVYSDEACSCGRATRRMWVKERLDDMVKVKGVNIFASGVEEILHGVEHVGEEFRLVVDRVHDRDTVALQVEVLPPGQRETIVREVARRIHAALGISFDVDPLDPGTLPKTELKARRWLDRRPKD
ncbi:MAG: AMP-binding protein [Candidatus Dormibacteraeota bacterium]|nr:AMP-binding protein [Candidatus Dormibacteraeota bacterium]